MLKRNLSATACAVAALLAAAARAQNEPFVPVQPPATVAPDALAEARAAAARGDAAEALSRYLRVLASRPDDPAALTGAGRAALEVGDVNAAAGFLARAEARDPRNGEVKAGLAVTLLQRGDARGALRYFREAVGLGIPVAGIAADRGLAYDLRGDQRRAQADYQLALAAGPSDETVRRLALSQAIAGERDAALATLDPLLRRQNVPAWRARAFVFALTGDAANALTGAALVMPRDQLDALAPYLPRLAALKAGDKAAAIHLGRFPGEASQPVRTAAATPPPTRPPSVAAPAAADPFAQPLPAPTGSAVADAKAREQGLADALAEARARAAARSHVPAAIRARAAQLAPPITFSLAPAPPRLAQAAPVVPPDPEKISSEAPPAPAVPAPQPVAAGDPAGATGPTPEPAPATAPAVQPPPPPPAKPAETRQQRQEEERKRKAEAAAKKKAADEAQAKADERKARAANPARHWVQVAGGANKADLGRAWDGLKAKWPKQLAGRAPWTTHYRFTNRLLIGPFATSDAAQDWVGERKKEGFATFRVETGAGDPVERVRD